MARLVAVFARPPADPRPDGALLAAFLSERDEAAFAELVRRHGPLVWATCRRALPDPADAEDAFQATFLVLVRRAGSLTAADSLGPWLYRVAAWTGRALRRKNARRRALVGTLPDAVTDPRTSATVELDDLLLALPSRYRSAVVLCHLQGLTHREAADRLGCAEGTVASLISRALAKLRAKLGREPAAVLALTAAAAVPAELSAGAVRSAVAFQLTTLSAAAPPAVARLTEGVLRMLWVKKATSAAAVMVLVAGLGLGLGAYQARPAVADDPGPGQVRTGPPKRPTVEDLRALERELAAIDQQREEAGRRERELALRRTTVASHIAELKKAGLGRIQIRVTVAGALGERLTATELDAGGKAVWTVTFPPEALGNVVALRAYLTRARQDKDGPRELTVARYRTTFGQASQNVVKAARDAGFEGIKTEVISDDEPENVIERLPIPPRPANPTWSPGDPAVQIEGAEVTASGAGWTAINLPVGGVARLTLSDGKFVELHSGREVPPGGAEGDVISPGINALGVITIRGLVPSEGSYVRPVDDRGRKYEVRITVIPKKPDRP